VQSHSHRSFRSLAIAALAVAAVAISGGSALAAHQTSATGSPGAYTVVDKAADPAGRCSYVNGGVAGGLYLTGIRQINPVELSGTGASLQSVAVRPLVQHLVSGHWSTVRKGTLISSQASLTHSVSLTTGLNRVPVATRPQNPFRLALKLIWYYADASVRGTRVVVLDSYARLGGGVGSTCQGFVSTVD
jgi:hypothetical protein